MHAHCQTKSHVDERFCALDVSGWCLRLSVRDKSDHFGLMRCADMAVLRCRMCDTQLVMQPMESGGLDGNSPDKGQRCHFSSQTGLALPAFDMMFGSPGCSLG